MMVVRFASEMSWVQIGEDESTKVSWIKMNKIIKIIKIIKMINIIKIIKMQMLMMMLNDA